MEVALASLIQNAVGQKPSKQGIISIIQSVGAEASENEIDTFLSKLGDKDINVVINEGLEKMASCQKSAGPAPAAESKQAEEKKEEAPKAQEEEIDVFDALF